MLQAVKWASPMGVWKIRTDLSVDGKVWLGRLQTVVKLVGKWVDSTF